MTTVMAFGTFDLLHPGHKYFLKQAKKYGNRLIVVIARDSTVKQIKGKLPRQTENQRLGAILSLKLADKAVLGNLTDKYAAVKKYRPDVICLGYDQTNFTDQLDPELAKLKLAAKIIRIKPFKPHQYKTSIMAKNNLIKIFNFLKTAGNLKKTLRYKSGAKIPKESVADHTWRLALMSFIIADELKIKMNIAKALEIALLHDLAEAITGDIDALLVHKKLVSPIKKQALEEAAMKKFKTLLPAKTGQKILKLWHEYNRHSSLEARYIYALDKLEALTYLTETGHRTYNDDKSHHSLIPIYADKAVVGFEKLKPILRMLKGKLKKEFKKGKFEWKEEYEKV